LLDQTYPLEEILLVDNGSTEGTLDRTFPEKVTIIRHSENRRTSGAVATGFEYALGKGCDWIWILDADSTPRKDALEKLVELYHRLAPEWTSQIGILSSCIEPVFNRHPIDYCALTRKGPKPVGINKDQDYCDCDATLWSGSLFNLQVVRKVGYPKCGVRGYWEDFCLDWGDVEFCYRIRQAGYRIVVHRYSIIGHPLGMPRQVSLFGQTISTTNHPAYRRYLLFRNMVYFWLHVYSDKNLLFVLLFLWSRLIIVAAKILLIEEERLAKLWASLRGTWDGFRGNMDHRY
jgi:GT2 family glycosyltransferase